MSFSTIPGARQHERRSHTLEFEQALADKLPAPKSELMEKLALIEARSISGKFFDIDFRLYFY